MFINPITNSQRTHLVYTLTCSILNRLWGLSHSPQQTQQHRYPRQQSVTHSHHRCQLSVAQPPSHRTIFISQVTSHSRPKIGFPCFDNCVGVVVICVLIFTVFCIVCTVYTLITNLMH